MGRQTRLLGHIGPLGQSIGTKNGLNRVLRGISLYCMVLYCIRLHCMVLHCIALHRIAWHCIAFDYLFIYCMVFVMVLHGILLFCMVLHRLHGVVQLIWRAGELPRSASSHFVQITQGIQKFSQI